MLFNNENLELRKFFFDVWQKFQSNLPLEPLEQQLAAIMVRHPEYHSLLANPESAEQTFTENNPFLHISLHQAIMDQVNTNRPAGVTTIYQELLKKHGDVHEAEHQMMEQLALTLWDLIKEHKSFDENVYLEKLRKVT